MTTTPITHTQSRRSHHLRTQRPQIGDRSCLGECVFWRLDVPRAVLRRRTRARAMSRPIHHTPQAGGRHHGRVRKRRAMRGRTIDSEVQEQPIEAAIADPTVTVAARRPAMASLNIDLSIAMLFAMLINTLVKATCVDTLIDDRSKGQQWPQWHKLPSERASNGT